MLCRFGVVAGIKSLIYAPMMSKFFYFFALVLCAVLLSSCSKKVTLKPFGCGPLARGELGVVFSAQPQGSYPLYFVKGEAYDLCPKIMTAESILGSVSDYCDVYEPYSPNECASIKVLTILDYR